MDGDGPDLRDMSLFVSVADEVIEFFAWLGARKAGFNCSSFNSEFIFR